MWDQIARVINLQACIGNTEILNAPSYLTQNRADWVYFEWSASSGIVMEQATDDSYELVIKHKFNRQYQTIFYNFPELSEWRTKALFQKHPTKSILWRYVGRMDDLIVFSNGEKANPVLFEKTVETHPWVQGALVVGVGQFQADLIIEPQVDYKLLDEKTFIDAIWPVVAKANLECPAHAKVFQSMITISTGMKHFKRAPKGSVMRQASYQLYEAEIAALYQRQKNMSPNLDLEKLDSPADLARIKTVVRKALHMSQPTYSQNHTDDTNFFMHGFGSLQVLQLSDAVSYIRQDTRRRCLSASDGLHEPNN